MFGKEPAAKANTYACFVRRYDADHLARHPYQKVTSMKLLVHVGMRFGITTRSNSTFVSA